MCGRRRLLRIAKEARPGTVRNQPRRRQWTAWPVGRRSMVRSSTVRRLGGMRSMRIDRGQKGRTERMRRSC